MILTGKLFKFSFAVNGTVFPPVIVAATDMVAADNEVLAYGERLWRDVNPDRAAEERGLQVRILSATEIDLEAL